MAVVINSNWYSAWQLVKSRLAVPRLQSILNTNVWINVLHIYRLLFDPYDICSFSPLLLFTVLAKLNKCGAIVRCLCSVVPFKHYYDSANSKYNGLDILRKMNNNGLISFGKFSIMAGYPPKNVHYWLDILLKMYNNGLISFGKCTIMAWYPPKNVQ